MSSPTELTATAVRPLRVTPPTLPAEADHPRRPCVAILGNPNAGKSTLFNQLTGLRQKVANYPGVTVEKKTGVCELPSGRKIEVLDLPGSYSLRPGSPDEVIVRDVLLGLQPDTPAPDLVVFVLDATNLERHLYFALQILEIGRPVVIALNMSDLAESQGIRIDEMELEHALGAPVVAISAAKGTGIGNLRRLMDRDVEPSTARFRRWPPQLLRVLQGIEARVPRREHLSECGRLDLAMALLLDDGEDDALARVAPLDLHDDLRILRRRLDSVVPAWSTDEAQGLYEQVGVIVGRSVRAAGEERDVVRERIDRVLTHRILGPVLFAVLMGVVFQSIFTWATPAMDAIDSLVAAVGRLLEGLLPAGPLRSLVVDGVVAGVGSTIAFVPQIAVLFFFLTLMEDSGYMARAAFIMDRLMAKVGLSGRSFIPLLSSFACAIPGIMAARTIESRRDRLATIMVAPFMSCSARLPVYALLIGAFIPDKRFGILSLPGIVLFSMYLLGIVAAIAVAWTLKRTVLRGGKPLYVMELPPYRMPSWRSVLLTVRDRCVLFLRKAGTVILAVSIVLWFLASYPKGGPEAKALGADLARARAAGDSGRVAALESKIAGERLAYSFAGRAGRFLEPAIEPLGFDWKIGIGLITSFAAREVMVSTMATVYNLGAGDEDLVSLKQTMRAAKDPRTGLPVYSALVAVSLMVFFVLACQCMSTVAVARRETNSWKWALFMLVLMNGLAWGASFVVFQGGTLLGFG